MPLAEATEKIDVRAELGVQLRKRFEAVLQSLLPAAVFHAGNGEEEYWSWDSYNTELLRRMFTDESVSDEYSFYGIGTIRDREASPQERAREFIEKLDEKLSRLRSIRDRLELFAEPAAPRADPSTIPSAPVAVRPGTGRRAAFIVHGHDEAAREATARVLAQLDVEPIILHEQANRGQTVIEKFERHSNVRFAVVLLTPDDVGRAKDETELRGRARQNVWFELGFFVAKLGRDKVCALHKGPLEIPSDIQGVIYTPMDDAGAWRYQLANELHAAGIEVDLNRLRRS
jgi:hypothetical protein